VPAFNLGLATFNKRTVQNYKYDWSQDVIEEPLVGLTAQAQADVIANFKDTDSACRFQAFWTSRSDYLPCEDTGAAAMSGLQYMLLQCNGSEIRPLPAWPASWNVDFKLSAPSNTSVRLVLQGGVVTQVTISPPARTNDLVEPPPPAPAGLTAKGGNTQAAVFWNGVAGASSYSVKRAMVLSGPYVTVASALTGLSYVDASLLNGTNYWYAVSALNLWGESTNSAPAAVTPGPNFAVHFEGDLIVNLQSQDLSASTRFWTNRTSNSQSAGNFATLGGGNLNVANLSWNGRSVKTLFVNSVGNNSVQSALASPAEINSNNPVSVEAWIKALSVSPKRAIVNYGYQGGPGAPVEDREFSYDTGGSGVISGDFGNLDTAWATAPDTNAWHYLAYTWDGSTLTAYLDGVQDVQRNVGAICKTVQTFMQMGSGIGGTGVNGGNDVAYDYIACVRVESGVLTPGEVAANYAMGPLGTAAAVTPAGLTAIPGDGQVGLTWIVSSNASGYNVKRSTISSGPYAVIATNLAALSFTNTGLSNGTTYYFVVSAINQAGESANSVPVGAEPVSATPTQLSFGTISNQVRITWPQDHLGWILEVQTNPANAGIGTNWVAVPASTTTNGTAYSIDPASGSVFFRLVHP
jgi:hypothetical protein